LSKKIKTQYKTNRDALLKTWLADVEQACKASELGNYTED